MPNKQNWLTIYSSHIDTLKNIVEIIAIIMAASWAVFKFVTIESPPAGHPISPNCSWVMSRVDDSTVQLDYTVGITNTLKKEIKIDSIQYKVWYVNFDSIKKQPYFLAEYYTNNMQCSDSFTDFWSNLCYPYCAQDYAVSTKYFFLPFDYNTSVVLKSTAFGHYRSFGFTKHFCDPLVSSIVLHLYAN